MVCINVSTFDLATLNFISFLLYPLLLLPQCYFNVLVVMNLFVSFKDATHFCLPEKWLFVSEDSA